MVKKLEKQKRIQFTTKMNECVDSDLKKTYANIKKIVGDNICFAEFIEDVITLAYDSNLPIYEYDGKKYSLKELSK